MYLYLDFFVILLILLTKLIRVRSAMALAEIAIFLFIVVSNFREYIFQ